MPRPPLVPIKSAPPPSSSLSPQNSSPKPGAATANPRAHRRRRSPAPPPIRQREAPLEHPKEVRNLPVLFVRVLVLFSARSCSPELAPPRPSAPSCSASSPSPDRSYRCPRSIMHIARITSVLSMLQTVPRSSNPGELVGASPVAAAHRCQRRRSSRPGRPQLSDRESMAQIKSNPGQCDNPPRKIPYYRLRPIHFGLGITGSGGGTVIASS
jgi:hypothetical protein